MAHKKGVGSTTNGRDSNPKYLGVKRYDLEKVRAGHVLVRQRGTNVQAGKNVAVGRDHTLYSLIDGYVLFEHATKLRKRVSVYAEMPATRVAADAPRAKALVAKADKAAKAAAAAPAK